MFEVLYNQIFSRVIVNGYLTEPIPILRSVKQGDALSCVLFVMCMETIVKHIQNNNNIRPIKIKNLLIPKVLAYADDIAVLVADPQSVSNCIDTYSEFSKCSGLYLNVDKTEVLSFRPIDSAIADKTKAYECISLVKLKQPMAAGGISAPDILSMCKALMIRQLIRSTSALNHHSIKYIQIELLGFNPNTLYQVSNSNLINIYFDKSILYLAELGDIMLDVISSCNKDTKLNKDYYDLIASEMIVCVIKKFTKNPIIILQAKQLMKISGITFVGQLINEYKYPSSDICHKLATNIINECNPLLKILANRKYLSYGISFRDGFFLITNITNKATTELQFTTKLIRQCLFKKQVMQIDKTKSKLFCSLQSINHLKEREIAYFNLYNVLLTNEKLFDMNLIPSPNCPICDTIQTSQHIFLNALMLMSPLWRSADLLVSSLLILLSRLTLFH
jgi:hypothetical protein